MNTIPRALAHKIKKRRPKKKTLPEDVLPTVQSQTPVTNTAANTIDPPVTTSTTTSNTTIKEEKMKRLRQKMEQLKSRRTGVERRQQVQTVKESAGPKPKNAMRNMAREGIHELLTKVGVNDAKVESEIMNEIMRGTMRTPNQVADFVVQKLQKLFPNGPEKKQPTHSIPVPSNTTASSPSNTPSVPSPSLDSPPPIINAVPVSSSGRKPLKHPTPNLRK